MTGTKCGLCGKPFETHERYEQHVADVHADRTRDKEVFDDGR